ncbi:MAG: hypothetical protein A2W05_03565 [Candidatus Schekmanbacteria bacterium RBG_16_38_10]|uniref:Sulfotransferase domain-containing protein n=1 Tax=Candidatus Schekmanbacteria bacterium RBG_16_38_10 TaxID=1817879 RepID=A0A1F7S1L7_9BACT|nr:MAG: hypothetical protein A2W05_03565 [Candidatus Schekmanbacteria bacterium RBG_16_38_10]
MTNPVRLLPDFIIIGAQKCGTTTLYNNLIKHPYVIPALRKEIHFFDLYYEKGVTWYQAHFPSHLYKSYFLKIYKNFITGEATPYYIFHPLSPERTFEIVPKVKLIVLLRNPVDRAYSHYQYSVRMGHENLSFEDAIQNEMERMNNEREIIYNNCNNYSFNHQHFSYLSRGIYIEQLRRWHHYFPRDQILILKSEEFYLDPSSVFKHVYNFLNLPDLELNDYKKYNVYDYEKMDPITRRHLIKYYEQYNQELYDYLGVNFNWNK